MSEATPHLRTILDLLEIRGCRTEFQPRALMGGLGVWTIFYEAAPPDKGVRSRMIYPDERGETQAMELLKELNGGTT